ncbi:MAG: hypothetical protein ACHQAX_04305 [Gammaproteobacteria bacterium]
MRIAIHHFIHNKKPTVTHDGDWTISQYARNKLEFLGQQAGPAYIHCQNKNGTELALSAAENMIELNVKISSAHDATSEIIQQLPAGAQRFTFSKKIPMAHEHQHSGFVLMNPNANEYLLFYVNKQDDKVIEVVPDLGSDFRSACIVAKIGLNTDPGMLPNALLNQLFSCFDLKKFANMDRGLSSFFTIQGVAQNHCFFWKPQVEEHLYDEMVELCSVLGKEMQMTSTMGLMLKNFVLDAKNEWMLLKFEMTCLTESDRLYELWKIQGEFERNTALKTVYANLMNWFRIHHSPIATQMEYVSNEYNKKRVADCYGELYDRPQDIAEVLSRMDVEDERLASNNNNNKDRLLAFKGIPYFRTSAYDRYLDQQNTAKIEKSRLNKNNNDQLVNPWASMYRLEAKKEPFSLTPLCKYVSSDRVERHCDYLENIENEMTSNSRELGAGFTISHLTLSSANAQPRDAEALVLSGLSGVDFSLTRIDNDLLLRIVFEDVPCATIKNIKKMAREIQCEEIGLNILISNLKPQYSYAVRSYESVGIVSNICKFPESQKQLRQFIENLSQAFYVPKHMQKECLDLIDRTIAQPNAEVEAQSKHMYNF